MQTFVFLITRKEHVHISSDDGVDFYHRLTTVIVTFHTTDIYIVQETVECSGEFLPTHPVSNISVDPSQFDWGIQMLGSKSTVM